MRRGGRTNVQRMNYRIKPDPIQPDVDNTRKGVVAITLTPKIGQRQRVVLLLNEFGAASGEPRAYSFDAGRRDADRYTIRFPIRRVSPGDYLVRVQVDGAGSPAPRKTLTRTALPSLQISGRG